MLIDPAFREAVCDSQGSLSQAIQVTDAPDGVVVKIDQVLPATGIPSFAAKFVGEEIAITRTEQWVTRTQANIDIIIPGKPGQLVGTLTLVENNRHTTQELDSELSVTIPFIGAKLESMVADLFRTALDAEAKVASTWQTG